MQCSCHLSTSRATRGVLGQSRIADRYWQTLSRKRWLQELRQRIRDSYEARWKAEKHFDEDQILNEMPGSLRIEVCLLHPVLDACHGQFWHAEPATSKQCHATLLQLLLALHVKP